VLQKYKIDPQKITAVPLAADGRFQPQPESEIQRIRQTYNLPADYLLYLGINKPHKNLPLLLQAYNALARQHQNLPALVIAGAWDGRYPQAKQAAAQSTVSHLVHFLGPIPEEDLPALYSGALFFIFPSLYEGFGLPVIEAMACGTAVICAQSSSLIEVAGEAALTFNPHQTEDLITQMQRFLDNPELIEEYEKRGLKQVQTFSWQATAVSTLNCYRTLLRKWTSH
jgi:alpha-1,3-rhamnosyl/mannosyltransferase